LKVVLSLAHGQLPASLNFDTPHPDIPLPALGLRVQRELSGWPDPQRPLVAGVSSFGMGGTNCHLVVTAPPPATSPAPGSEIAAPAGPRSEPGAVPWLITGRTPAAVRSQAGRLLSAVDGPAAADVAWSLLTTRSAFEHAAV